MEPMLRILCSYISRLRCWGRDADDVYVRRHIVPAACGSGGENWDGLDGMSSCHIYESQVSYSETRQEFLADGVVWHRSPRSIFRLQECSCE